MNTFILLNRKIMEWEWYTSPNVFRVFVHCLIRCNHKDNKWRGSLILRGSFISSYDKIASELDLTRDQVRYAMTKLTETKEITTQGTNKYLIVTVCNYDTYQKNRGNKKGNKKGKKQDDPQSNPNEIPDNSQTDTNQVPPNNNENNENNENNYLLTTSVKENCLNNTVWVDAVKNNYVLSDAKFHEYIEKFTNYIITQGKTSTSAEDYKRHFISWYKKHTGKGMNGRKILNYRKPAL